MSDVSDKSHLQSFFRIESVQEARSTLGVPINAVGLSSWLITALIISASIVAIAFAATTKYAQKETVFGQVTPVDGALRIVSNRPGIVKSILVRDGERVTARQELASISFSPRLKTESYVESLRRTEENQAAIQTNQAKAKLDELNAQLLEIQTHQIGIKKDIDNLKEARSLQISRVEIQDESSTAAISLGEQGMLPKLTVRQRQEEAIAARQALAALERETEQQSSMSRQLLAEAERVKANIRLANLESISTHSQLYEKSLSTEAEYEDHLVAPCDGVVTAIQTHSGAPILANQTLAIVVPVTQSSTGKHALEVELYAPSKAIGFVQKGTKVRLMFDAFSYQTFGVGHGTVSEISSSPVMPNEIPMLTDSKEPMFKIRVPLDNEALTAYGKKWPLTSGMRLSADLVLEERTLLDWLLDPLLAQSARAG